MVADVSGHARATLIAGPLRPPRGDVASPLAEPQHVAAVLALPFIVNYLESSAGGSSVGPCWRTGRAGRRRRAGSGGSSERKRCSARRRAVRGTGRTLRCCCCCCCCAAAPTPRRRQSWAPSCRPTTSSSFREVAEAPHPHTTKR